MSLKNKFDRILSIAIPLYKRKDLRNGRETLTFFSKYLLISQSPQFLMIFSTTNFPQILQENDHWESVRKSRTALVLDQVARKNLNNHTRHTIFTPYHSLFLCLTDMIIVFVIIGNGPLPDRRGNGKENTYLTLFENFYFSQTH